MSQLPKILFIEDEEMLSLIIKDSLEAKGFDVKLLNQSLTYYEEFLAFKPHLILLDIMMPDINGYQIAEKIREKDKVTPIIFLTAKVNSNDVLKAFEIGANDYIKKPFTIDELVARINVAIRNNRHLTTTQSPKYVVLNKYHYNYSEMYLMINDLKINIPYKENELLNNLVNSINTIVPKQTILKTIWDNDNQKNSKNLDVLIVKLRGYLKQDASIKILNVKGVGYKLTIVPFNANN